MTQSKSKPSRLWGGDIGRMVVTRPEDIRKLLRSAELWSEDRSACQTARAWVRANNGPSGLPAGVAAVLSRAPEWSGATTTASIFEYATELDTSDGPSMTDVMVVCKLKSGAGVIAVEGKAGENFDMLVSRWLEKASPNSGKPKRLEWARKKFRLAHEDCLDLRWQFFHRTASAILKAKASDARHAIMLVHDFTAGRTTPGGRRIKDHFGDFEKFGDRLGFSGMAHNAITPARVFDGVSLRLAWVSDTLQSN